MKNHILLLIGFLLLTSNCIGQQTNDLFKFKYLNLDNQKLNDSTKLKLLLYFNKSDIVTINSYLEDNQKLERVKNIKDKLLKRLSIISLYKPNPYIPKRLKRLFINDKYGYKNWVIDSAFYKGFRIKKLTYLAEKYYDEANETRQLKLNNTTINRAIKFIYDEKKPILFNNNSIKFNICFYNISSKNIKSFSGKLFITNRDLINLFEVDFTSNLLPTGLLPNPLNSNTYEWIGATDVLYYTHLLADISDYTKSILQKNYKDLILIFIPNSITFKDGTIIHR